MGWFSSGKSQARGSLPVINLAERPKNEADAANDYLSQYLAPTKIYGGEKLQCLVPSCITTLLTAAPPTSRADLTEIENYIRETKTIPSLAYVPDDLKYMTDKDIWWFVPGVVVAGPYFSWVAVSKDGLYCASTEDENDGMQVIGWDHIDAIECKYEETNCCCLHMHTAKGTLSLSELLAGDRSSSLPVVKAIYDVYKPVIEASRGAPMWHHGAGGESYRSFESPQQLLVASAWGGPPASQNGAVSATDEQSADSDDASGREANDEEAREAIPALNWTPVTLNGETDPPYPGRYFFVPPPLASKMIRVKLFPALARASELFPDFTADDVNAIADAIRTTQLLPRLSFVRGAMEGVFAFVAAGADTEDTNEWQDITNHGDAIWFMPAAIVEVPGGMMVMRVACALWLCENGLKANFARNNVMSSICWSDGIESLTLFEDTAEDSDCPGCAMLKIDIGDEVLRFTETHGEDHGSMFKVLSACWDVLSETVIEPSRGKDSWDFSQARFVEYESWEDLLSWAHNLKEEDDNDIEDDDSEDAPTGDASSVRTIYLESDTPQEFIDVARRLLSGEPPVRTTPREVFGWFGYSKRAARTTVHVQTVLRAAELEAFPNIADGLMDSPIQLRRRPKVTPGKYTIDLESSEEESAESESWVSDDRPTVIVVPEYIDQAFTKAVRSVHATGRPKRVVVRELLGWFGQQRRGPRVQATIADALVQARLEAFPDPAFVHIDSQVELSLAEGIEPGTFVVE